MIRTCSCGQPTQDLAYLCESCGVQLGNVLVKVPWLLGQLDITMTKQVGVALDPGVTGSSTEPLPLNLAASFARAELIRAVREIPQSVERLPFHPRAPRIRLRIIAAYERAFDVIDRRPDLVYLGECGECHEGSVYAPSDSPDATCRRCGVVYDALELRTYLLRQLDDRLCTATEAASLSAHLLPATERDKVRNRIYAWKKRGRIVAVTEINGEPAYRFGEVYALLTIGATK